MQQADVWWFMQEVQIQRLSLHTVNLALASRYTILEEKVLQGLGEHWCGGAGSATYVAHSYHLSFREHLGSRRCSKQMCEGGGSAKYRYSAPVHIH